MPARRRYIGSENEPFIVIPDENTKWQSVNAVNASYPNNVGNDYYLDEEFVLEPEPEPVMTGRDRTAEFANTIQSLQGRNIARAVAARDPKKSKVIQSHSEFMLIAKNVGKNLSSTYSKLEKLTLCKKCLILHIKSLKYEKFQWQRENLCLMIEQQRSRS